MIANVKSTKGIGSEVMEKVIHKGSESIMFSVLQETQYMYPFKSSVREIVSNSLDSINERNNALKIIKGEIKEEDLFITKEGEEFKDSRFDPSYYDEKWLSTNDDVTIHYIENDSDSRDRIQFIDEGVGLGSDRLINYFSLGFSTKRLNKSQLGSFGLGAKSLLATGVDFYTVTSRYNGREYKFNVYKDHVVSVVPVFNEDGTKNKTEVFYNDYKCHYTDTTKKNTVIIEAEVKRHRKNDFIEAIKNQLGFIESVKLLISDSLYSIHEKERDIQQTVLYKTDKIIVGDRDYYAVPQIILKPGEDSDIMINYGPINFDELEMKRYSGNVAFIMNINDLDVTPSRESVIWNTRTRNTIKKAFLDAQELIAGTIREKLEDISSLPDHLNTLAAMKSSNTNSSSLMSELYKIVDVADIDISYRTFAINTINQNDFKHGKFIFSSIKRENGWSSAPFKDAKYDHMVSKPYLTTLAKDNSAYGSSFVYVGRIKYKNMARYYNETTIGVGDKINMIYIEESYYYATLKMFKIGADDDKEERISKINDYLDRMYKIKDQYNILLGETFLAIENGLKTIFEDDIDRDILKKSEKVVNTVGMTSVEKAKLENKFSVSRFSGGYNFTGYYNEKDLEAEIAKGKQVIVYTARGDFNIYLMNSFYMKTYGYSDKYIVLGMSTENIKRALSVDKVTLLFDALFTIEFGDFRFTQFAKDSLPDTKLEELLEIFQGKRGGDISIVDLRNSFATVKLDANLVNSKVSKNIVSAKSTYIRCKEQKDTAITVLNRNNTIIE